MFLILLSGFLFSISLPPFRIGAAAYWALVPFFFLLREKNASQAFWWGGLSGAFIAVSSLNFMSFNTLTGWVSAIIVNSAYFAIYSLIHVWLAQKMGSKFIFIVAFLWTGIEFLKTQFFGGELSWANLGYTHPQYLFILKNATTLNLFSVCFWLVLINFLIYSILIDLGNKRKVIWLITSILILLLLPKFLENRSMPKPQKIYDKFEAAFAA